MSSIVLDKQTYPLMMHLSILPKYNTTVEEPSYEPGMQTTRVDSMKGSWCTVSSSTGGILRSYDDDSQEDD